MMVKKIVTIVLIIILCFSCVGCMTQEEALTAEISQLKTEVDNLRAQKAELEESIIDIKVENNLAKYILTIEINQVWRANWNGLKFEIPVSKEFYESVSIDETIEKKYVDISDEWVWLEAVVIDKKIK